MNPSHLFSYLLGNLLGTWGQIISPFPITHNMRCSSVSKNHTDNSKACCYHFPEVNGHIAAVLQHSPDEQWSPWVSAPMRPISGFFMQDRRHFLEMNFKVKSVTQNFTTELLHLVHFHFILDILPWWLSVWKRHPSDPDFYNRKADTRHPASTVGPETPRKHWQK